MSKWGPKLEKKLNGLADSASKETIQTVANWIGFNRKHSSVIGKTLGSCLTANSKSLNRQWLFWQVIHELLILHEKNSSKWEKMSDLRALLGEHTIIPAMESIGGANISPQVEPLLKQWDEHNVFGGPTLVSQIRRLLTAKDEPKSSSSKKPPASPSPSPAKTQTTPTTPSKDVASTKSTSPIIDNVPEVESPEAMDTETPDSASKPKETNDESVRKVGESAPVRRTSISSMKQVDYDFESKNVPKGKVHSREFLDPCKAIAQLQIARDLRNDSAVQVHSLLTKLPENISALCEQPKEEIDDANIRDCSIRISSDLLDLDLEEQIQNIKTFKTIIIQQRAARKQLIHLLLKSRCKFGAEEAAQEFLDLAETSNKLKRKQTLLADALELEGMDAEIENTDFEKPLAALPKFSWYKNNEDAKEEESADASPSKKARIE